MKRYGNLFERIISIDNLYEAHRNARKGKRHYEEVQAVEAKLDYYMQKLCIMLASGAYKVSPYATFEKNDRGKARTLYKLPYFPDRIIQHAIMQVVEPIWKATLIPDTHQAIKGRGVHSCLARVEHAVQRQGMQYCLQIDIKSYYPSICNVRLKQVLRHKIKCRPTLELLDSIVDSCEGIPIGNYISQYFGNLYLSKLDHLIKEVYRVRYYFRYCDDLILLGNCSAELHQLRRIVQLELEALGLRIKENYQVYRITPKRGVDCLGYLVYHRCTKVRRRIGLSYFRAVRRGRVASLSSYEGWLQHCRAHGLRTAALHQYNRSYGHVFRYCRVQRRTTSRAAFTGVHPALRTAPRAGARCTRPSVPTSLPRPAIRRPSGGQARGYATRCA